MAGSNRRASLSDRIAQFDYNSSDSDDDEAVHPPVLAPTEAPQIDSPPPIYKDASLPPHVPTMEPPPPTYAFSDEVADCKAGSGAGDPPIELDHVWENQWRQKPTLLSTSKVTSEWLPTGKKQGRSAFESPSEGLSELFEHHNGPPPGVLEHVGLPSRDWRWLGPWMLDLGDLKACDRTRADGSEVGSDAEWFCADAWLSGSSKTGGQEVGYYPARDATTKTAVRCRRWVRPRERRPQGLAGRGAHVTSLASATEASDTYSDNGQKREDEEVSPTETALLAAADAQRLNDLLAYGSDSDNESLSEVAEQSQINVTNTGALVAEAINDDDEPLRGNFNEACNRTVSTSTTSTSSISNCAAGGGSKALASGSPSDEFSNEDVEKAGNNSSENLSGLAGAASWARSMRSRGEALATTARLKAEALLASQKKSDDFNVNEEAEAEGESNYENPPPDYETWSFGDAVVKDDVDDIALQQWDCEACAFRNHVPAGAPRVCEMCATLDDATEAPTEAGANDSNTTAVILSPSTPASPPPPAAAAAVSAAAAAVSEPDLVVDFVWQNERWVPLRKAWVPSASSAMGIPTKKRPSFEACCRPSDQGVGLVQLFGAHNGPPTSESQIAATTTEPAANLAEPPPSSTTEESVSKESNFRLQFPTTFMSNTLKMRKLSLGSLSKGSNKCETVSGGALSAAMTADYDDEGQPERTALRQAGTAAEAEGLPSSSWRWVGPWLIDSENFGVDRVVGDVMSDPDDSSDQSRGKGSSESGDATFEPSSGEKCGGWLYGGLDWPKHDVGYSRTGGRSKLVRCRRWVRPRERVLAPPLAPVADRMSSTDECHSAATSPKLPLTSPLSPTQPHQKLHDLDSPPTSPPPPEFDAASNTWVRKESSAELSSSSLLDAPPPYDAVTDTQPPEGKLTAQTKSENDLNAEDIANLEYDVLLEFYQQCGGASWQKSKGWSLATRPVSDWTGITVVTETLKVTESEHASANSEPPLRNKVLRVSGVNLGRNSLSGSQIPWEALSELQLLSSLDLSHNNLSGGFPMSFPLQRCTKLDLSFNKLTGPLPPAFITPMPCLEVLCLSSNALTGEGPWEALQKMPALKLLALDCNDFNGPIPTAFDGFASLDELKLLSNPLLEASIKETASFATFAQLPRLRRFDLFEVS